MDSDERQGRGAADLQWIKLGQASDNEIKSYIDKGLKFSDIFETADKDTAGFTKIKAYPSGKVEWLKVKPGMEQAAAFMEARRYGAILGATSEFNKMEGVSVNEKDKKVYIAVSYLEKSMEKDTKGEDPADHIQLPKMKSGATYELSLQGSQKDSSQAAINSSYVPATMKALVIGEDLAKADEKGNTAAVDKVANPDNVSFSQSLRTLFIGEDSGMHANNFLWAYNVDTKKLSRIMSVPAGAEATGLQMVDDLNGFAYIMSNLQHPGDEMIVPEPLKAEVESYINKLWDNKKSGSVGYISGLPSIAKLGQSNEPRKGNIVVREEADHHGAKVQWNQKQHSLTVSFKDKTLYVKIGSSEVTINGQKMKLQGKVDFHEGRVLLPAELMDNFFNQ
ncbi:stalk domain-containing protein [Cohnella kolymensis]|uniref:stalk domain-containing protein n=1 Tax=Cohnella kolymensis TaxID=1590652 RepID=UPI002E13057D